MDFRFFVYNSCSVRIFSTIDVFTSQDTLKHFEIKSKEVKLVSLFCRLIIPKIFVDDYS